MNKLISIILWLSLGVSATHYCHESHLVKTPSKKVQDRQSIIKKKERRKQTIKQAFILVIVSILFAEAIYYLLKPRTPYPPTDISKFIKNTNLLYKIEYPDQEASYLHGIIDTRSGSYTISTSIKELTNHVDRLVTVFNYYDDKDLCSIHDSYFKALLKAYEDKPLPLLESYFKQIEKYKEENKLVFMDHSFPWMPIAHNGKGKYPVEEFYQLFASKKHASLSTLKEDAKYVYSVRLSNPSKIGEKLAADMWQQFKKYQNSEDFRIAILKEVNKLDESTTVHQSEREEYSREDKKEAAKANELCLPKIVNMMQEKRNLFLIPTMHLNHILLLLLKKKYTITRIHEDSTETAVTLDNYNEPYS
ncbi:MAG: hypothetical protein AAF770_01295 [Bacteroidota bacterium]